MDRDVQDVLFLLDEYGDEIRNVRAQLNKCEVNEFFDLSWTNLVPPTILQDFKEKLGKVDK